MKNRSKVLGNFRRVGFGVSRQTIDVGKRRTVERILIEAPDDAVSVVYYGKTCYVGLEGMTPSQSYQLARIWVDAYEAQPNSDFGNGVSKHVSGAWRRFVDEPARIPDKAAYKHRIYIAAYKTWPKGVYDPQRNALYPLGDVFSEKPGAAVKLSYGLDCIKNLKTGPRSGVFLSCSKTDFQPR